MSSIPAVVARRHRTRTALVLAGGAAALVAAALLGPRGPAPRAPVQAIGLTAGLPGTVLAAGPSETYLAIGLTAPDAPASRRSPASLAIVLDRSGSMSGPDFERAKSAAMVLIDRLSADDEIALVSYASGATLDLPLVPADEHGKAALRRAMSGLRAGGNTDLAAGLERGGQALARAGNGVRRIVLLSDGRPTWPDGRPMSPSVARAELLRIAGERAAARMSITTVGFGLDYDEALMSEIASAGRGNYYFVERTAGLADMFTAELDSLGRTVIADSELRIEPAPGVTITDVLGYHARRDAGGAVVVPVTDLRAASRQKVVLAVRTDLAAGRQVPIATVTWRFRVVGGGDEVRVTELRAAVSADPAAVAASADARAVAMIEEARTAVAIDAAAGAYATGDLDSARIILSRRAAEAQAAADGVGDAELGKRLGGYATQAQRAFAAPPSSAATRDASVKANRAEAWDLAR